MTTLRTLLLTLSLAVAGGAFGCDYPRQDVDIPDGRKASHDEMVDSQKIVKAYVAAMEEYLACIEPRTVARPEAENPVSEREATINAARYDAAVDKMEETADRFNEALRQYREDR